MRAQIFRGPVGMYIANIYGRGNKMYKILIIEDEEFLRRLYSDAFKSRGYQVESAENGEKGIEMLSEYRPELVILDLRMPVMDGYQFLQKTKNDPALKKYPVILLTNCQEIREIGKCLSLGAIGYLEKTGSPTDVVKKVETVFQAFMALSGSTNAGPDNNLKTNKSF